MKYLAGLENKNLLRMITCGVFIKSLTFKTVFEEWKWSESFNFDNFGLGGGARSFSSGKILSVFDTCALVEYLGVDFVALAFSNWNPPRGFALTNPPLRSTSIGADEVSCRSGIFTGGLLIDYEKKKF